MGDFCKGGVGGDSLENWLCLFMLSSVKSGS